MKYKKDSDIWEEAYNHLGNLLCKQIDKDILNEIAKEAMKITENELCCKKCQKVAKTTKVGDKIKCRDCDSILAKADGAKRYGGIPCIRYVPTNQGELKTTITYEED
jgi:hypothetical protein